MRLILTATLAATLAGCGGGGNDSPPPPVASAATFPVRAAYGAAVDGGINLNLVGQDNDDPTANRPGAHDWTGTISISSRTTGLPCANAVKAVDVKLVLVRSRDNYRMQEAATFGYGAGYRPLCALLLDGNAWKWNVSELLPENSKLSGNLNGVEGIEFTGVVAPTPPAPLPNWLLTSIVGLDSDTSNTAFLSFVYHVQSTDSPPVAPLPFRMFGENTELRYRIDTTGQLLGMQYVRTGVLPGSLGTVTLRMTSR